MDNKIGWYKSQRNQDQLLYGFRLCNKNNYILLGDSEFSTMGYMDG